MTIDGYTVPSDIQVEVPLYLLHHHPDIWEDPEVCIAKRAKRNRYLNYNPQRSCGKVMFLHVSVILSTWGVWQADIPPHGQTPPAGQTHTPLAGRHPLPRKLQRTVLILLECILVFASGNCLR